MLDWIDVKDKLPPDGEDVLCWYEYWRYGIGYQYGGNWGGEVTNGRNAKVLYWMPLPNPPKERID